MTDNVILDNVIMESGSITTMYSIHQNCVEGSIRPNDHITITFCLTYVVQRNDKVVTSKRFLGVIMMHRKCFVTQPGFIRTRPNIVCC